MDTHILKESTTSADEKPFTFDLRQSRLERNSSLVHIHAADLLGQLLSSSLRVGPLLGLDIRSKSRIHDSLIHRLVLCLHNGDIDMQPRILSVLKGLMASFPLAAVASEVQKSGYGSFFNLDGRYPIFDMGARPLFTTIESLLTSPVESLDPTKSNMEVLGGVVLI